MRKGVKVECGISLIFLLHFLKSGMWYIINFFAPLFLKSGMWYIINFFAPLFLKSGKSGFYIKCISPSKISTPFCFHSL